MFVVPIFSYEMTILPICLKVILKVKIIPSHVKPDKDTPKSKVGCICLYFEGLRDVYQVEDRAPCHG